MSKVFVNGSPNPPVMVDNWEWKPTEKTTWSPFKAKTMTIASSTPQQMNLIQSLYLNLRGEANIEKIVIEKVGIHYCKRSLTKIRLSRARLRLAKQLGLSP